MDLDIITAPGSEGEIVAFSKSVGPKRQTAPQRTGSITQIIEYEKRLTLQEPI